MRNAKFTKKTFKQQPVDFRIGTIISDGMWLSQPKWRKLANVSEPELEQWISENLPVGNVIQSPTGAKSYRMPYDQILAWYYKNGYHPGEQLLDHIFPVRIWDDMTETEGFMSAPLREIGMVTFHADRNDVVDRIREALLGIGRIRESEPGKYRVYALSAAVAREKVEPILKEAYGIDTKIYTRNSSYRRELKDFSDEFGYRLVEFYQNFARSLVKGSQETINIFIEDKEDQETQLTLWVIHAIEKFNETASVPFSGYLNTVINRWVYDLPDEALGKELSQFQREKAKALKTLNSKVGGEHNREFSNSEIATIMGYENSRFFDLESRNKLWSRLKSSSSLTWDETSEEKQSTEMHSSTATLREKSDIELASRMSYAVVESALNTGDYDSAFSLITQIDSDEMDLSRLENLDPVFVREFGNNMGLTGINS